MVTGCSGSIDVAHDNVCLSVEAISEQKLSLRMQLRTAHQLVPCITLDAEEAEVLGAWLLAWSRGMLGLL